MPLSKQPLVLVLAQVSYSPIRQISDHISKIQEAFRRAHFPLENSGKVTQVVFKPGELPTKSERERWEYRTKDETWSVIVMQDSIILQTTAYDKFENFAETLQRALSTVFNATEHSDYGVVQRIGLRYIDAVKPSPGEDFRLYLRPGLHGIPDNVFRSTCRLHVENSGRMSVGNEDGTMVVRVTQNDQGFSLPPDLLGAAPTHKPRTEQGELITLIDMDHFMEGKFDANVDWVIEKSYRMHDQLIETFHDHVVTKEAIEAWK